MELHRHILAKKCLRCAIWIIWHALNTMNRDEGAHYLSHVYDPLLITPTSGDHRNRRGDQVPSFWWSVLTRTQETVNREYIQFGFVKRTLNIKKGDLSGSSLAQGRTQDLQKEGAECRNWGEIGWYIDQKQAEFAWFSCQKGEAKSDRPIPGSAPALVNPQKFKDFQLQFSGTVFYMIDSTAW